MDLSAVPVVDNHCHSLLREPVGERDRFRLLFTEAFSPSFATFVPGMAYYQAALIELADELGVTAHREAAYLTALYPHVYADLSYAVPTIGRAELCAMTLAALAVAPISKLLHSSDGHSIPEHTWLGARRGREIVATVLDEMVASRELAPTTAEEAGAALLRENARRVYRLDTAILTRPILTSQQIPDVVIHRLHEAMLCD